MRNCIWEEGAKGGSAPLVDGTLPPQSDEKMEEVVAEACTSVEVEVEGSVHEEDSSCCVREEEVDSSSPLPYFHC